MSHEERQHTHTPTTAPKEYGQPPTNPMFNTRSTRSEAVAKKDMPDPGSGAPASAVELTGLERWAVTASDSQFNALAGAIGGFTSGVVTCPLDVIKTKLQAQGGFAPVSKGRHVGHPKVYEGLVGTARVIWREEGIRGMYRGLGPIILGYLPTWAVWFTVYNKSKNQISEYYRESTPKEATGVTVEAGNPALNGHLTSCSAKTNQFVINLWSSLIAGASSTIVTNPIWVIKTRLMSQSVYSTAGGHYSQFPKSGNTPTSRPVVHTPWHYRSTLDAARKMYSHEGILSFYSGLSPALLGLSHVAVQFPAYEYLKTKFTGQGMGASPAEGEPEHGHWFGVLSASILSKILASSATYPHEVIRTRLQTQRRPVAGQEYLQGLGINSSGNNKNNNHSPSGQATETISPKYKGVIMTFRTILREEGWRAFYAGMGTNMMRAVPAATVTMLTYEYVMGKLNRTKRDANKKLKSRNDELAEP
jgi:solute carrier family 25 (mitochondrial folate transporter), member 32